MILCRGPLADDDDEDVEPCLTGWVGGVFLRGVADAALRGVVLIVLNARVILCFRVVPNAVCGRTVATPVVVIEAGVVFFRTAAALTGRETRT